ncbi:low temperature requirement protein A [Demequina sp. SYSU T00039]|uniref:Low temperature requirement protein A n=1 Tax=Demequina lignilytica TaxID=3051663 RepID=A0AAW7M546_9MICO|nr:MULTISPECIES: low temperature requirement protein A [unclassified Demequina]MDN4477646.1 low temperature requirement protein A [Demequina sp. SYSU T00039-1]MDN4488003.1 low temperature requirement protein A [Demequina sp. SYSU T00039]
MRPRDPGEEHRAATPLELFFDLVFVVAVSIAASELHHALAESHIASGLAGYLLVFFGIWWAWMNFTWFATSFATDDWLYRALVVLQMAGVLVLAAGIGPAFSDGDLVLLVLGYVVMRVAMIAQWLRAARRAGDVRTTALTYAVGIGVLQVLWLAMLLLPDSPLRAAVVVTLIVAELAVPVVAERRSPTPWHPHHITERYGLFTIIVVGESLLAASNAIIEALHGGEDLASLASLAVLSLVIAAALWWIYFWPPHHLEIGSFWGALRWGYAHYLVFASAAAVSAGIEVEIDAMTDETHLSEAAASFTVTVPVAIFMVVIWWITVRHHANRAVHVAVLGGAGLVLADPLLPLPFAVTAIVLVGVVVVLVLNPPATRDVETEQPLVEEDA